VGTGYSYPLPFAVAMLPLAALPLAAALVAFVALSLVAFGGAVAWWLRRSVSRAGPGRPNAATCAAAVLAGAYPPVFGSLFNGQANLLVVALFGWGVLAAFGGGGRPVTGAVAIGLAAVVKLVPAVVAVPLALAARWRDTAAVIATCIAALVFSAVIAPFGGAGSGRLVDLVAPDPFFSNQSINGFVSRLVTASDVTRPLAPGSFDPLVVGLGIAVAFGLVNVALLSGIRARIARREVLVDSTAMLLIAAVIAAPKNSFWNQTFLLVAVGLLVVADGRLDALRGRDATERLLLVTWFAAAVLEQVLWAASPALAGQTSPVLTLAFSSALYGAIALWLLFARRLMPRPVTAPDALVWSAGGRR
jgi:Glycosyltransferase family 87